MHNRMKEALVILGRQPRAVVRPPLCKLSDAEIADIASKIQVKIVGKHKDWFCIQLDDGTVGWTSTFNLVES